MAIVAYTHQDEYDLVNTGQDCIGWTIVDQAGNQIGKVTEMLIDTDKGHVDSIIVSGSGAQIPAADIALRDNRVVVRGVRHEQYTETQTTTATTAQTNYAAAQRDQSARQVQGVTRQANDDEILIPIVEEQLQVGKRTIEGGGVRVRTHISTSPVEEQINLREEHVHVERHAVNRPVNAGDANAFQEGTVDITTKAEVAVVAKEARVVEEVTIDKEVSERVETVRDTVRRTDVEVDEINSTDNLNRRNG